MLVTENPFMEDLHKVGVVAKVLRMLEMPDNTTTVILQGFRRIELLEITQYDPYLKGRVRALNDIMFPKNDKETRPLMEAIKDMAVKFIRLSDIVPPDSAFAIRNINSSLFLVDFLCAHLPVQNEEKIELLMMDSLKDRAYRLLGMMSREVQLAEIKASIQMRAREDIDQQQREYFLQQQIKTIQDELGGNGSRREIEEMRKKANTIKWNEEVKNTFLKEVARRKSTSTASYLGSRVAQIVSTLPSVLLGSRGTVLVSSTGLKLPACRFASGYVIIIP